MESSLCDPYIRQGDRSTEGVGQIPCLPHARHAFGIRPLRYLQVPTGPGCEPQETRGCSTREVVVLEDEFERPTRTCHSGGHIALRLGLRGTVDGDPTR